MMRRPGPEDREETPPLWAFAERQAAAARAEVGMTRAADKASRIDDSWRATALAKVREFAKTHASFLAEEVGCTVPPDCDPRAFGVVMQDATRARFVEKAGYAPANSSNRSPKCLWRSLIHVASTSPAASPKE